LIDKHKKVKKEEYQLKEKFESEQKIRDYFSSEYKPIQDIYINYNNLEEILRK